MKYSFTSFFCLVLVLLSCTQNEITPPPVNLSNNLANTVPIPSSIMENMEGIYTLGDGQSNLGTEFVCKVSFNKVSFFGNQNGIFLILSYGLKSDNSIQFSGFWRVSETSSQGTINFAMRANDGALDLINSIVNLTPAFKLVGIFKFGGDAKGMELKYAKPFSSFTKANEFMIFGHHGIQTTANPPYAENSVKGVLNAEGYGVNGMELDVRLTKDHVPIFIHDAAINTRLTLKGPLFGNYDQYSFDFLTEFITLIDGQKIPSVEQILRKVVDSTSLKYVWLDIKGNDDIFKYLEPVIRNAYSRAVAQNRDITIFAGLPSDDVIAEFNAQPTYKTNNSNYINDTPYPKYTLPLPTLCELSVDCAIANGSRFFGPRYSEGLLLPDVDRAHAAGIKVISWTLNDKNTIKNYLQNGRFDGFITDYPAIVVYNYYTMF